LGTTLGPLGTRLALSSREVGVGHPMDIARHFRVALGAKSLALGATWN